MGFMSPNIDAAGRRARAVLGAVFLLLALALFLLGWGWLALLSAAAGAFTLFEAARGWCVARACGIKTRI
jgi:hypothetical protein